MLFTFDSLKVLSTVPIDEIRNACCHDLEMRLQRFLVPCSDFSGFICEKHIFKSDNNGNNYVEKKCINNKLYVLDFVLDILSIKNILNE